MHGQPDRIATAAADIDVGGPAPAVDDGEDLVRGEVTERRDRYCHPERDAEQHVVGVIDGQVQAGQAEQGNQHGRRDLAVGARAARNDQAVHRRHGEDRDRGDRDRRCRVSAPAADDKHAVRARPGQAEVDQHAPDDLEEEQAAQEDRQVPPAPEDHDQDHDRHPERGGPPAAAGRVDPVGHIGQPRRAHIGQPQQHPGVGRSPVRRQGVISENKKAKATMTSATRTHAVVLTAMGCGSGGGAPVGRRWRRVPWTSALPGWPPGAAGVGGAGVRSALSVMTHAAFPGKRRTVCRRVTAAACFIMPRLHRAG